MLYIITEDSNSARTFWDYVASTFRGDINYKLMPFLLGKDGKRASGNTTLWDQLEHFVNNNKDKEAELLLVFDSISGSTNFNSKSFVKDAINLCHMHSITLKIPTYYCFEEIFLSYSELSRMLVTSTKKKPEELVNVIEYVQEKLINNENYFIANKKIKEYIDYMNKRGVIIKNRERFANILLTDITNRIGYGWFRVVKSGNAFDTVARCWIKSCEEIGVNLSENEKYNICDNKCNYICKGMNTKEKLLDLDKKSITSKRSYGLASI